MNDMPVRKVTTAISSKDYSKDYALALFEHFKSPTPGRMPTMASFCASMDISVSKFRKWLETHPEFNEVWEIVQTKSLSELSQLGIDLATGDVRGNVTAFKFMATNLHPDEFKDKQVTEHQGGSIIMVDTGIKRPGDEGYQEWIEAEIVESDEDFI